MNTSQLRKLLTVVVCLTYPTANIYADIILSGDAIAPDPLNAGTGGNTGTITINAGEVVTSTNSSNIGVGSGSNGQLTISDSGTSVQIGGGPGQSLEIGSDLGDGQVTIENNAIVTIDAFVDPGFSDARLNIGRGGNGNVVIQSGAQLILRDQNLAGGDDGISVGFSTNFPSDLPGSGSLTVQGEGSYLEVNSNLAFLNTGTSNTSFTGTTSASGTVNILGGADVLIDGNNSVGILGAGRGGNATGTINVSGVGTTVTLTGSTGLLAIGNNFTGATGSGTGILNVSDGAEINLTGEFGGQFLVASGESSGFAIIDSGATVTVDGRQADPTRGGNVTVGGAASGTGLLLVNNTGVLSANNTFVRENGILGGTGTIDSNVINVGGTIIPGASPGTLTINGDFIFSSGVLELEIGPTESDFLNVLGNASFTGGTILFDFIDMFIPDIETSFDLFGVGGDFFVSEDVLFETRGLPSGVDYRPVFSDSGFSAVRVSAPDTLVLFGIGLLGLGYARRKAA